MAGISTDNKYSILESVRGTNLDSFKSRKDLAKAAVIRAWPEFETEAEYIAWVMDLAAEIERKHKEDGAASFGDLIEQKRKDLDLSLQKAADRLGITKTHLWELEKGKQFNPGVKLLNAFRQEYSLSAKKLLDALDSEQSNQH